MGFKGRLQQYQTFDIISMVPFTAAVAEEEEEDDLDEGGQRPIFVEGQDPLSVLAGMEEQDPLGRQPFELLAAANQRPRSRRAANQGAKARMSR